MIDDSSQSPIQDNQTPQSVSPDQASPAPVEEKKPEETSPSETTWPNSTILANDQPPTTQVSPPPVTVEEKPEETPVVPEPPKEEVQSQTIPSEIGQSASTDNTWPNTPKMANTQPEEISPSDQSVSSPIQKDQPQSSTDSSNLANPPSSLNLTNSPTLPNDTSVTEPQLSTVQQVKTQPEPLLYVEASPPQTSQSEPSVAENKPDSFEASKSDLSAGAPAEAVAKEGVPLSGTKEDISVISPDNQAPQVQPEAPNDAPNIDTEKPQDQLATFNPEPSEQPQEAPLANNDSEKSSQKTFGDLLSGDSTPISPLSPSSPLSPPKSETPPSPQKPVSFGDLIKDIEIEITPPSIPEAQRSVEQPQPIPPSQPQPQVSTQVSPASPQSSQSPSSPTSPSNPPEPQVLPRTDGQNSSGTGVIEKVVEKIVEKPIEVIKEVVKEVPVVDQEEAKSRTDSLNESSTVMDKQLKDKLKAEQDQRRIFANQARSQKKSDNLNKIMEYAKAKQSISNEDVQKLLRVSQSTATNYLAELSHRGMLKREGIRGGTRYTL